MRTWLALGFVAMLLVSTSPADAQRGKETPAQIKARKEAMFKAQQRRRSAASQQARKRLTESEAKKLALRKFPGTVVGCKIGYERTGKWEYTVLIRSGNVTREVWVDSITGIVWGTRVRRPGDSGNRAGKKPWEK